MSASPRSTTKGKLKVLLVDDDEEWSDDIERQAQDTAFPDLEFVSRHTYEAGLEYLRSDDTVDLVLVDYTLNDDKNAVDFVREGHASGRLIPYVIVSQTEDRDLLSGDNQASLRDWLAAGVTDFIGKREISSMEFLQRRIDEIFAKFATLMQAFLGDLVDRQLLVTHKITQEVDEAILLLGIVRSYSPLVGDLSFDRLLSGAADGLARARLKLANFHRPPAATAVSLLTPPKTDLDDTKLPVTEDYIPYSKQRAAIIKGIRSRVDKMKASGETRDQGSNLIELLLNLTREGKISRASMHIILFKVAQELAAARGFTKGFNLVNRLSRCYRQLGEFALLAAADMMVARYLIDHKKTEEASRFLASAVESAIKSNSPELTKEIKSISYVIGRSELTAPA